MSIIGIYIYDHSNFKLLQMLIYSEQLDRFFALSSIQQNHQILEIFNCLLQDYYQNPNHPNRLHILRLHRLHDRRGLGFDHHWSSQLSPQQIDETIHQIRRFHSQHTNNGDNIRVFRWYSIGWWWKWENNWPVNGEIEFFLQDNTLGSGPLSKESNVLLSCRELKVPCRERGGVEVDRRISNFRTNWDI